MLPLPLAVGALIAITVIVVRYFDKEERTFDSIAVLTFEANDSSTAYLSSGIPESISNSLSQFTGLRVRTGPLYSGMQIRPEEAGRRLQVDAVLTGKVTQLGEGLLIETQLLDVEGRSRVYKRQYKAGFADILSLQDKIVKEVS